MKILVIDNYDSFTYNLVQLLGSFNCELIIKRNDETDADEIKKINPNKILISPGPGKPEDSKVSLDAIKFFGDKIPILGICLGHQAIGICFGGNVVRASKLMHGKTSRIKHNQKGVFKSLPQNFIATRYHSLIVDKKTLPDCLEITATSEDGMIMGIKHKNYPIEGVQFHPESILTTEGKNLIKNWLEEV